ncbi:2OG-Fe(II) oxygenase superfamily protein [Hirsutella rhossiliensis]|uniref:2OG-Fe(II) oxygenase superfamily domain-containing protein n=1 Tax=Hirsutella rhossiliensis TaxID=111463 RepID=A0A9P8N3H7_9HYPO|nr:2OG-Fe(II) oxygenase superfamily domain-containing protein [Hirsutella rhossiliensis]KAH0965174.1 2OG-Fe(II) oxygenase superfamily domain-containing protein [Hirsutella rhossiliensis]
MTAPVPAPAIPVIDLAGDQADVARQLVSAAQEHGFIYIRNLDNDITADDVDRAFALSRDLFDAPADEKRRCSIKNNRGWAGMHVEALDPKNQKLGDFKEAFNFGEFVDGKAQQPLPSTVADKEPLFSAFADSCRKLCHKILYLLGLGLDVGEFLSSAHFTGQPDSGTTLRFLCYPPAESAAHSGQDVRAGAHSDYGSITLLFRLKGQAGLEVLDKNETWAPVPVCPPGTETDPGPPILVNIGDLLSYWTNGLFRSTVHRVVFPTAGSGAVAGESSSGTRYSIAFFCHPVDSSRLEPVPSQRVQSCVPAGNASDANPYAKRKVLTAAEHLTMRLNASYGASLDNDEASKA